MKKLILISMLAAMLLVGLSGAAMWDLKDMFLGNSMLPAEGNGAPWMADNSKLYFGTGQDGYISYDPAGDKIYLNDSAIYLEEAVTVAGGITGTSTDVKVGNIIDTGYGLKNSTSGNMQVNLSADMGLAFDTGSRLGALKVLNGHGIDLGASGVEVDPDDIRDPLSGLVETTTNHLGVNLTDNDGLGFGTGSELGALVVVPSSGIKNTQNGVEVNLSSVSGLAIGTGATEGALGIRTGLLKHVLAAGTAASTNVTVTGMASGDELISVFSFTTAAAIATVADRTAEYAVGSGVLIKAAGTDESNNQLDIWYMDRTA